VEIAVFRNNTQYATNAQNLNPNPRPAPAAISTNSNDI
jgi:hypothetical protein